MADSRRKPETEGGTPELLTIAQVAEYLGISPTTARLMTEDGRLPIVNLNVGTRQANGAPVKRLIRVRRRDVEAFIERATEVRKRKR